MSDAPRPCPTDWEARWQAGDAPWDLGRAPPALEALLAELPRESLRVVVPGAGRGHDAVAWALAGHDVTALDIAPTAVAEGRALAARLGATVDWRVADLFAAPEALQGTFDVAWEQTCYCAIPLERRDEYVQRVADLLVPGGRLFALLWNHGVAGGPPFDVTREDARARFAARFEITALEEVEPWASRRRGEFLVTAVRAR